MCGFVLPPPYQWDLHSSGLWRSVDWQLVYDISVAETSETDYKFTLRNIPEECRSQPMNSQNTKMLGHVLCWRIQVLWDVTLCRWVSSFRRFERSYSLRIRGSRFFLDSFRVKVNALRSSETSRTTHPTTQRHTPEDLNHLKHRCENLISRQHFLIIVINSFLSSVWFYLLCQYIPY